LYVVDQDLKFVGKPFPSFIREKLFFVKLPVSSMVGSLNKRLHAYFENHKTE